MTPGDGTVIGLRHKASGQLHLPGGTLKGHPDDNVGDLTGLLEKQLGVSIGPNELTRFRRIGTRQYHIYTMPLQLSKERLSQFKQAGSAYSRLEFVSVEQPRAKAGLTGDHTRMCDLFGDLAAKCLPVVNKTYSSTLQRRDDEENADPTTFRHVPVEEITPELIAPASAEEEGPLIVGPNMFAVFTVKKYA